MSFQVQQPDLEEIAAYCLLWQERDMGPRKTSELTLRFQSALEAWRALAASAGHTSRTTSSLKEFQARLRAVSDPWEVIDWHSPDYPQVLKYIKHPPPFLFLQGDVSLLAAPNVAIVGTRNPSREGILRARRLSKALCTAQISVASGLAQGIDTAAHAAALEFGGKTIAVIGTSLRECYPPANRLLQDRIKSEGLVVSQFPFFSRGHNSNFVERNRVMAAISDATVVIEAGETSGVVYQVKFCLEVQKPLFLARSLVQTGHAWIEDALQRGARVLEQPEQVIEAVRTSGPHDA
ncbi:MAG: DNA-protecting protein DprA [Candidatus Wallbacteria bacterium]|nr:DNA-protecting protein DprA [Candidatus Wallbacteria bacterium]